MGSKVKPISERWREDGEVMVLLSDAEEKTESDLRQVCCLQGYAAAAAALFQLGLIILVFTRPGMHIPAAALRRSSNVAETVGEKLPQSGASL